MSRDCNGIAEKICEGWIHRQNSAWKNVVPAIAAALQAAEQRGREEGVYETDDSWLSALSKAGWTDAVNWGEGAEDPSEGRQGICCRIRDEIDELKQQPKTEPSRECEQIGKDIASGNFGNEELPYEIPHNLQATLARRIAAALQAKQDELDALRAEVLGVISRLLLSSDAEWYEKNLGHDWRVAYDDALALRDKLKASQPTSPQPQTPHQ